MLEIVRGQKEFNLPIITANRKLVASEDGGLRNPSYLVFNSGWGSEQSQHATKTFNYPSLSGIKKPRSEEDIAFMSVSLLLQSHWAVTMAVSQPNHKLPCILAFVTCGSE